MSVSVFELYMAEMRGNYQWDVKDDNFQIWPRSPGRPDPSTGSG